MKNVFIANTKLVQECIVEILVWNFWYLLLPKKVYTITILELPTQPAFTCSKLTLKTLEQGVKYVQS